MPLEISKNFNEFYSFAKLTFYIFQKKKTVLDFIMMSTGGFLLFIRDHFVNHSA
jgi:hypothetical protein